MYFCRSFVLAALPFLTVAVPLTQPPVPRSIAIPIAKRIDPSLTDPVKSAANRVANSISKIQNGITAYKKNTGSEHPLSDGIKLSRKRDTGSDPLTDDNANLWYGSIQVGTPPENFEVDFDTGSSDLFLPATGCTSNCQGHKEYNPSASSTSHDLGKQYTLSYAGGSSVSGEIYTDSVAIAGQTAYPQALGASSQYSSGFAASSFPPDGLMGMAFQSISVYNQPPVFQTLISQNKETNPVFSFKLAPSGPELFLGGANKALYTGDFTWVKLTNEGYWQAPLDSVSVNGESVQEKTEAIFDTGSTMIIGDPVGIQKLFDKIPGSAPVFKQDALSGIVLYTMPCRPVLNFEIAVTVGGKKVNISFGSFNLGEAVSGTGLCLAGAASDVALIGKFWVLGDVYLQNVYTSFDVGNGRIGFADLA